MLNSMIDLGTINSGLALVLILASIFGGGIASFFIIRSQLLKITQATLKATQDELKVYKERTSRLEADVEGLKGKLILLKTENLSLVTERDYLKSLIINAINSKKDIHKELLDELKKPSNDTQLYRDGEEELNLTTDKSKS